MNVLIAVSVFLLVTVSWMVFFAITLPTENVSPEADRNLVIVSVAFGVCWGVLVGVIFA